MTEKPLYFDYNSSAPSLKCVQEKMLAAMQLQGNASSPHSFGRRIRIEIERVRAHLAKYLYAGRPDTIIFNSGCSEGNNTVVKSFTSMKAPVIASSIEHPCILNAHPDLQTFKVNGDGIIDLESLNQQLYELSKTSTKPILLCLMLANNETGVIQPYADFIKVASKYNTFILMDAAQALGRIEVNLELYPVDYITLSSHKIGGPTGVGTIYVKPGAPFSPLISGGGQEKEQRAGSHHSHGIIAMGAALEQLDPQKWDPIRVLRDALEDEILKFEPQSRIWCYKSNRLANTSSIMMPYVKAQTQMMGFDLGGIAISAGSACSSGKIKPSHVLYALGATELEAESTIRVSLCPDAQRENIERFLDLWKAILKRTQI